MIKKYLVNLIDISFEKNNENILKLLDLDDGARLVDLGCNDGSWTLGLAKRIGTKQVFGVEIVSERIRVAESKGIKVSKADLNCTLPYSDNFFDVVHANQVIEHLYSTDIFVSEILRILKPGGYAIISSENLSSWHNIFSLIFGFQPFSMSNFSVKGSIGNPFSLWKGKMSKNSLVVSWQHNRLFSYFGLKDLFEKYGFSVENILMAGYYPSLIDFSSIDKIHGHWITLKIRKPYE